MLNAPYSDKTLMRNTLAYALAASTGHYAPRTRFCEVWLGEQYQGVYVLTEKIKRDKHRVDIQKYREGATPEETGFIVKIDKDTGTRTFSWRGVRAPGHYSANFHCDYPQTEDLGREMQSYIRGYLTEFEQRLHAPGDTPQNCRWCDSRAGWLDYIDLDSFVDYMIIQELAKNVDGYRLSTFMHKHAEADGGKLVLGPLWDVNLGFDNADYGNTHTPDGWAFEGCPDGPCHGNRNGRPLSSPFPFWWARLLEESVFTDRLRCRWDELRRGDFSDAALTTRIADLQATLAEAQARNFEKWPILRRHVWPNPVISGSWEAEVERMRAWILSRTAWMDRAIASMPHAGGECE